MFSSFVAIIMFLSIFTSRYAEEYSFQALPRKLLLCLALLLFSVTWTVVAFACLAYLVFFGKNSYGFILVFVSLCLAMFIFSSSQYPLLFYLHVSTYCLIISANKTNKLSTVTPHLRYVFVVSSSTLI
ncbi:hypothetical protein Pint_12071 [Pistacia integerrima]|uniref:Uncharacterized protein n=1 Tax=Pistacia integerrima TaxID=434235 RepID=A0ACC0XKJ2_9ROSI|nr:hypothetical protein Pint_12071 [Pistacia integerrima]